MSGYFNDQTPLIEELAKYPHYDGIYFTLNPIDPRLLSRSENRIQDAKSGGSTGDSDVSSRRFLVIDLDPVRPSGISASDDEVVDAANKAEEVLAFLDGQEWPDPAIALSGNGIHLLYRIDLPTDDAGLVTNVLQALSDCFSDDKVHLDTSVGNPSRLIRLYGTMACKGDPTDERPHRFAELQYVPNSYLPVSHRQLREMAALLRPDRREDLQRVPRAVNALDVPQWLDSHDLEVRSEKPWKGGTLWVLEACPWNSAHTNGSAFVAQFPNGNVIARCHHESCQGRGWDELRQMFESPKPTSGQEFATPSNTSPAIQAAFRRAANQKRTKR
ncbi:MAG: hypothetical protein HUJ26_04575 [Planctomycetaceae bacterium]|nr:hypothetical protein [Planctomycetaceae bacterium]